VEDRMAIVTSTIKSETHTVEEIMVGGFHYRLRWYPYFGYFIEGYSRYGQMWTALVHLSGLDEIEAKQQFDVYCAVRAQYTTQGIGG